MLDKFSTADQALTGDFQQVLYFCATSLASHWGVMLYHTFLSFLYFYHVFLFLFLCFCYYFETNSHQPTQALNLKFSCLIFLSSWDCKQVFPGLVYLVLFLSLFLKSHLLYSTKCK